MLLIQITQTEVAVITRLEPPRDRRQRFESFLFLHFPVELAKGGAFLSGSGGVAPGGLLGAESHAPIRQALLPETVCRRETYFAWSKTAR